MAAPAPFGVVSEPSPWAAPAAAPPPPLPRPKRDPRAVVAGLVTGLVVLTGGGLAGANLYAKQQICAAFAAADGDADAKIDVTGKARYLFFDADLRTEIDHMSDDADHLIALQKAVGAKTATREKVAEMVLIAGSVNSHARQAQKSCGLPEVGIFS